MIRIFKKGLEKEEFTEQSVYEKNEYYANKTFLLLTNGIFIVSVIFFLVSCAEEHSYEFYSILPEIVCMGVSFLAMAISFVLTMNGRLYRRHIKYSLFFITEITIFVTSVVYGFNYTAMLFIFPILISNRYPSKRFQTVVSAFSIIMATAMPVLCIWAGRTFKYVFFDHNQVNFFEGTVIEVGEAFYYSFIEHFDDIDWYYTYLDTFKEASVACFFMISLFVFLNYHLIKSHRKHLSEEATLVNNKLKNERDLLLAKSVQESALPGNDLISDDKIKVIGKMLPSEYVSGDFYDYFKTNDGKICLMVGDISGHGLPSAMFMMSVRNTLRAISDVLTSPAEIMTRANKIICEQNEINMFATIWFGIIDNDSEIITFVNAGHPFPFLKKSNGELVPIKNETNAPVGIFDDEVYLEHSYRLTPDDEIIIYTDGIIEATDESGKQYGIDNFKKSIESAKNSGNGFIECIVNDLVDYTKSTVFEDDVTLLTVYVKPG